MRWMLMAALVVLAAGCGGGADEYYLLSAAGPAPTGGGVGIGYSIHAGMVCVADGSDRADRRLHRVLTSDPGTGVMRHADAGYEEAVETARVRGVDLPMITG